MRSSPHVLKLIKQTIWWAGNVARIGAVKLEHKIYFGNTDRPFVTKYLRWDNTIINVNLIRTDNVYWVQLNLEEVHTKTTVRAKLKLQNA